MRCYYAPGPSHIPVQSSGWRLGADSRYIGEDHCGSGGTGRRARLRILWPKGRGGSNPSFRTNSFIGVFSNRCKSPVFHGTASLHYISAPAAGATHSHEDNCLFESSQFRDMKGVGKNRPFSRQRATSRGAGVQRSVSDIENLHAFHILLDQACEIPAPARFDGPSGAFEGGGRKGS